MKEREIRVEERAERGPRETKENSGTFRYTYQAAYSWFVLRMAIKHFLRRSECTVHRPSDTRTLGMTRKIEGEALPDSPLGARIVVAGDRENERPSEKRKRKCRCFVVVAISHVRPITICGE